MRADVNVSVRKPGDDLGTRCEIKNVNSIRFIGQAIEYEARRQIALIEDGDIIRIDAEKGTLDLLVEDSVMAERHKNWQGKETDFTSGTLWKYAQSVGPARKGAVTHPGGAKEKRQFADV